MVRGLDQGLDGGPVSRLAGGMAGSLVVPRFGWLLVGAVVTACTAHQKILGGDGLPPEVPTRGVARAAFLADVNVDNGRVTITAPKRGMATPAGGPVARPLSLVGGDAVFLTTSNFQASAVGAVVPGKVRITFDIAITNRLAAVSIVGPTAFPAPPPGTHGPILLPYDVAIATTSGGVGGGSDVLVVLPSAGLVAPSPDWDGSPWNFFNDSSCVTGNDCYRWEEFPDIPPGASTTSRTVGFDIDPTVGQFTARLIVGSDLYDPSAPITGAIRGYVTSSALGVLADVTVTANPGGTSTRTDAGGYFTLSGLSAGPATLTLSGLPSLCTAPAPAPVSVSSGNVITVSLEVSCTVPALVGTLTGVIQNAAGSGLGGVAVTVQPTGLPAAAPVTTDGTGTYLASDVPISDGTGAFTLSGLPAGCTDPGSIPYAGMASGATITINVVVACP